MLPQDVLAGFSCLVGPLGGSPGPFYSHRGWGNCEASTRGPGHLPPGDEYSARAEQSRPTWEFFWNLCTTNVTVSLAVILKAHYCLELVP